jgi:hypothetical protein
MARRRKLKHMMARLMGFAQTIEKHIDQMLQKGVERNVHLF